MAATTTLSAAVGRNDTTVLLAAVTNVVAGGFFKIEDEWFKVLAPVPAAATTPVQVLRGQEGSAQVAHATGLTVRIGTNVSAQSAGDWPQPTPGSPSPVSGPVTRSKRRLEFATAGAITIPNPGEDVIAMLTGTNALAMTLAAPSVLNDGDTLTIIGLGKAAHTVSLPAGVGVGAGGSGVDVLTFAAGGQQGVSLTASNGVWVANPSVLGGSSLSTITVTAA